MMDATDRRLAAQVVIVTLVLAVELIIAAVIVGIAVRLFTLVAWG